MQMQLGAIVKSILVSLVFTSLVACTATYTDHGYVPTDVELGNVVLGVDSRDSLEDAIGRPSSTGTLSDSAWYYISSRIRYFAYRKPEMIERNIVAISFDKNDRVSNIERFSLEDGRVILFSRRATSSSVQGTKFYNQLIRNFFNFGPGTLPQDPG